MEQGLCRFARLSLVLLALLALASSAGAAPATPEQMNLAPGAVPSAATGSFDDPVSLGRGLDSIFDFPSADSVVVGSVGFIDADEVGYFWTVTRGDSVSESFAGPATISAYALHVDVITNALNSGAFVNWDVIINGVTVDNFSVSEGFLGTVDRAADFASIAGPNYDVELRVTNVVAGGAGSHTFRYAGTGNFQIELGEEAPATQEIPAVAPLGLALLALLLVLLGFGLVRSRRTA